MNYIIVVVKDDKYFTSVLNDLKEYIIEKTEELEFNIETKRYMNIIIR